MDGCVDSPGPVRERPETKVTDDLARRRRAGSLSVLSLVNIVLVPVLRDAATRQVVYVLDALLSMVFLPRLLRRYGAGKHRSEPDHGPPRWDQR